MWSRVDVVVLRGPFAAQKPFVFLFMRTRAERVAAWACQEGHNLAMAFILDQIVTPVSLRRVWYTPRGAYGCARRIVDRMPVDGRWVMLTLTLDPSKFPKGPADAFASAMRDFPRFMRSLARLNGGPLRWARKIELQENGWPHFHIICDLRKLARAELPSLDERWGHGMTNITFIRGRSGLLYVLKYVTKGVECGDENAYYGLPQWLLDYPKRIRFWQTHNFYDDGTKTATSRAGTADACARSRPFYTIRQRIDIKKRQLEVVTIERDTTVVMSRRVFSFDFDVVPWLIGLVATDHAPGRLPDGTIFERNINIELKGKTVCQTLPILPLPGRVFVSLVA